MKCKNALPRGPRTCWNHVQVYCAFIRGTVLRWAELNRDELKLLFAPTGALQETSMDNGWAGEYLLLSERFDGLID